MTRLQYILLDSDLSLAAFLLGVGLIMWGGIAVVMAPNDLLFFAADMKAAGAVFWAFNYFIAGTGFIYCAMKEFPPFTSLMVGCYCTLVWTWIAGVRGSANFTSGVTLNAIVIVMGVILVQRSSRK